MAGPSIVLAISEIVNKASYGQQDGQNEFMGKCSNSRDPNSDTRQSPSVYIVGTTPMGDLKVCGACFGCTPKGSHDFRSGLPSRAENALFGVRPLRRVPGLV